MTALWLHDGKCWIRFLVTEAAEFADHRARPHVLRRGADGRPSFFVPHVLVQDLPDQSTQPVRGRPDGLGMAEPRDEPAIRDGEDGARAFTAALAA